MVVIDGVVITVIGPPVVTVVRIDIDGVVVVLIVVVVVIVSVIAFGVVGDIIFCRRYC